MAGPTFTDPETFVFVNCTAEWIGIAAGSGSKFYGSGNTQTNPALGRSRKVPDEERADWPVPLGGLSPLGGTAWTLTPLDL